MISSATPNPAEALDEALQPGILFGALQVLAKALADVGADQGLIAREAEQRSDVFQLCDNVFRHAEADGRHRTVTAEADHQLS